MSGLVGSWVSTEAMGNTSLDWSALLKVLYGFSLMKLLNHPLFSGREGEAQH
jgi:hypothetical protein